MNVVSQERKRISIELLEYEPIEKNWAELGLENERRLNEPDRELAETLKPLKIEVDELNRGLYVKADSWVGHAAFDSFDLVILPKFEQLVQRKNKTYGNVENEKHSPLAALLAYAFDFDQLRPVGFQLSPEAYFAEILVHWLLEEIRNIRRRGPFQRYHKEHRDLSVLRGKIDLKTYLRRGGVPSETMPCVFHHRSPDNILNQTLCAGLRRGAGVVKDRKLKSDCRFLADTFALFVTEKTLDRRMLADAFRGLNRLNAHYANAVKIVRLLYEGSGGFVHGDRHADQVRIPGFFFDMNVLFEKVVKKFLEENLPKRYVVLYNKSDRIFSGFRNGVEILPGKKWQARPDFIVEDEAAGKRIVLDTKYIKIGPGNEPLEQLCLYALAFSGSGVAPDRRATILFPDHSENRDMRPWNVKLHRYDEDAGKAICDITVRPIDMIKIVELIMDDSEHAAERRRHYAETMIGEKE